MGVALCVCVIVHPADMLPECSDVDSFMSSSRLLLKAFPKRPK